MGNYLDVLDKLNALDTQCDDLETLHKRLDSFRSLLDKLATTTLEAKEAGGEYQAVLVGIAPAAAISIYRPYNALLENAQRLAPENSSLAAQAPLTSGQVQSAWVGTALREEIIPPLETIYTALDFEYQPNEGCFVATATLGDDAHPTVTQLRRFRDEWLMTTRPGRQVIGVYYRASPSWARKIEGSRVLRAMTRIFLITPVAGLASLFVSRSDKR